MVAFRRFASFLGCSLGLALFGSVLSAQEAPPDPSVGFFAIGSCAANTRNHPTWIPLMKDIGVRNLRSFGTGWGGVEKKQGEWTFDSFDKRYDYLISQGISPGV